MCLSLVPGDNAQLGAARFDDWSNQPSNAP